MRGTNPVLALFESALKSPGRFRNHLTIAYGSAVETTELLELGEKTGLLPRAIVEPVLATSIQTQRLLRGLMKRYDGE